MVSGKILTTILFSLLIFSIAYAAPGIPHAFYRTVTVNGNPTDGASVVAMMDGEEVASATSNNGDYGYYPEIFYIENPNNNRAGDLIEFYLNGTKVAEFEFGAEEENEEGSKNDAALCENVDCSDENPCTNESCSKGVCIYEQLSGTACEGGTCEEGVCSTTPLGGEGEAPAVATGLFGLAPMQGDLLLAFIVIIFVAIALFVIWKRKK